MNNTNRVDLSLLNKELFIRRAKNIVAEVGELTEDIARAQDENRLRMELCRKLLDSINPNGKCMDCGAPCKKSTLTCAACLPSLPSLPSV